MTSTVELMDRGMKCLVNSLGIVEAERFITIVMKEKFDYTKWHRDLFEGMSVEEFNDAAADFAKSHPFEGGATMIE